MEPEEEFEQALQEYERAVMIYRIAWKRYVEDVGLLDAQNKLHEAMDRICALDQEPLTVCSEDEVRRRAHRAICVVDGLVQRIDELHTSPDIYAHRP